MQELRCGGTMVSYVWGKSSLEGVVDALGGRPNPFIAMENLPAGVVSWS
jgi:hypothetical protein